MSAWCRSWPPSTFLWAVNFATDRDLLGNPRRLGGRLDNGCFETWCITDNRRATNLTNGKAYGDQLKYVTDITATDWTYDSSATEEEKEAKDAIKQLYDSIIGNHIAIDNADFWNENYGGNLYPHQGSVVYVMTDANLVIDTVGSSALFTVSEPIRPGYVLVKSGGSIYGQGNALQFGYVAAEKTFTTGTRYGLISMPFDCYINATESTNTFEAYTYDASARSAYNYEFKSDNSTLWKQYDKSVLMPGTNGWLMQMNSALAADEQMRFTGWAEQGNYVYEETVGRTEKLVELNQYDDRPSDGSGRFTRAEDMGWNMVGLPYLVSGYRTDDTEATDDFNMYLPHVIYKMDTDGEYIKLNNNVVYASQSWAAGERLSLNEGFFVQTAAIGEHELLRFRLPKFTGAGMLGMARPLLMMRNAAGAGDVLRVQPDEDADKQVSYTQGRDGIKWMMAETAQMYMLADNQARLSLLGSAPTETNIQLGISVPSNEGSAQYTFSLPEPEAFEEYESVWLIDREMNRVTNLLESDYTTTLEPETNHSRLVLRIGGLPLMENGKRVYIVYSYNGIAYIRGLIRGDEVALYSASGQVMLSTTAQETEMSIPLAGQGIYLVRVNDFTQKVMY